MAVELEKIATLLEEAHATISSLEDEKRELQKSIDNSTANPLPKEASEGYSEWDDFGSVSTAPTHEGSNGEDRLDDFLND